MMPSRLYRKVLKSIPHIVTIYDLDISAKQVQQATRQMFEKNRNITDPRIAEWVYRKGELEFQETIELWKQRTHVLRLLGYDATPKVSVNIPGKSR